jgi:hypothetical protein
MEVRSSKKGLEGKEGKWHYKNSMCYRIHTRVEEQHKKLRECFNVALNCPTIKCMWMKMVMIETHANG